MDLRSMFGRRGGPYRHNGGDVVRLDDPVVVDELYVDFKPGPIADLMARPQELDAYFDGVRTLREAGMRESLGYVMLSHFGMAGGDSLAVPHIAIIYRVTYWATAAIAN